MQTSLYSVVYPPMIKLLEALSNILDKAAAHADSRKSANRSYEEWLLNDRLVFDQMPLVRQVQIATDNAKNSIGRLTGREMPVFEDVENTFAGLHERIAKTLDLLNEVKPEDVDAAEETRVSLPYWGGKSLSGFEYATEYLIPNFFFHVTTAYAIIRKNGVAIGKSDFLGPLPLK